MKRNPFLLAIALLVLCGVLLFFFYRMGSKDAKALAEFPAAYRNYDQAISEYSKAVLAAGSVSSLTKADLERKADQARAVLNTKASVRISSPTRHDGELMEVSREIASLTGQELETLKAYSGAVAGKSADREQLAQLLQDLSSQRQADYTRYLELAGIKN